MKKIRLYILLLILVASLSTLTASYKPSEVQDPDFFTYTDEIFKFSILIPKKWKKEDVDLSYKHILIMTGKEDTSIKITATPIDDEEEAKWDNWLTFNIDNAGITLKKIINEKELKLEKSITGKLLVFQYRKDNITVLSRVMLARFNDTQLVVECRSPIASFYRYDAVFDIVMSSLKLK
jgi:hypothetical protein